MHAARQPWGRGSGGGAIGGGGRHRGGGGRAVVDDEGPGARGMDANAEPGQPVVPGGPRSVGRFECLHRAFGERRPYLRGALSRDRLHGRIMPPPGETVNTYVNTGNRTHGVSGGRESLLTDARMAYNALCCHRCGLLRGLRPPQGNERPRDS